MPQYTSVSILGSGREIFDPSLNAGQPDFAVIERSGLLAANLWHKRRAPVSFETAGLALSVWPVAPDELADIEPIRCISISAGNSAASASVPLSLIMKILESYGLPSDHMPRDAVLMLLLEHRFAEAIEALERNLKLPVAFSGIDSQNRAGGPDIVHLNARCRLWEREYAIKLSLPAPLAFQLADLLDATAGAQHNGARVPIPVAYRIGVTQLGLRALESVRLGDTILADATAGAGMAFIAAGEQFLAKARWEGSTLTLLERPKKLEGYGEVWSMSNAANSGSVPDGIDAELNDIQIKLIFELGRQELRLGDVQSLIPGYVFDLNRDQRTAVDIYAGTQRIGLGEVVLINETLGIRITRLFNNE